MRRVLMLRPRDSNLPAEPKSFYPDGLPNRQEAMSGK